MFIQSCRYVMGHALRHHPRHYLILCSLTMLIAVLPSVQVVTIPRAVDHGGVWVVAAVIAFGGVFPLLKTREALSLHIQMKERYTYKTEFARFQSIPRFTPFSPEYLNRLQVVRDGLPFNIAWQATSILAVGEALIGSALLLVVLAQQSGWVACAVLILAVPEFYGNIITSTAENRAWPKQSEASRRESYVENLLIQSGTHSELSLSGGIDKVGCKDIAEICTLGKLWSAVTRTRVLVAAGTGAFATCAFLAAAAVLSTDDATSPGIIFGTLAGLYSAMLSTSGAGRAYGELLSSVEPIATWIHLMQDLPDRVAGKPVFTYRDIVTHPYASGDFTLTVPFLQLQRGETVCLWGSNGSGKTTLLRYIASVCGGTASYLPQDFIHLEFSVRDFLTISSASATDEQINRALRLVGLAEKVSPDTQLGEQWGGIGLSGGQWQRLAIARTILENSDIVLLDEPTSAVDAETEKELLPILQHELPHSAIVVVTHRPEIRDQCDTVLYAHNGTLSTTA